MKPLQWHKIADSMALINWQPNGMALAEAGGKTITLVKVKEGITACAHKCPHAGAILADGFIDALGNIVCPLHKYRFSPDKGRNVSGEGYQLKTYAVQENEEGVFVGWAPDR